MKRNVKFQLNVTENKNIIFLTKFILHMNPTLRKPVTNLFFFKGLYQQLLLTDISCFGGPMIILRVFKVD